MGSDSTSILDRAAISHEGINNGKICTLDYFLGSTDHRPILVLSHLATQLPIEFHTPQTPPPRLQYPRRSDKGQFAVFTSAIQQFIADHDFSSPIIDEQSFLHRYYLISDMLVNCSERSFHRRHQPLQHSPKSISSPEIRAVNSKIKFIGSVLYILKYGDLPPRHTLRNHVRTLLRDLPINASRLDAIMFLRSLRKTLYRDRYATAKSVAFDAANYAHRRKV